MKKLNAEQSIKATSIFIKVVMIIALVVYCFSMQSLLSGFVTKPYYQTVYFDIKRAGLSQDDRRVAFQFIETMAAQKNMAVTTNKKGSADFTITVIRSGSGSDPYGDASGSNATVFINDLVNGYEVGKEASHQLGHLLGLPHCNDACLLRSGNTNVMSLHHDTNHPIDWWNGTVYEWP